MDKEFIGFMGFLGVVAWLFGGILGCMFTIGEYSENEKSIFASFSPRQVAGLCTMIVVFAPLIEAGLLLFALGWLFYGVLESPLALLRAGRKMRDDLAAERLQASLSAAEKACDETRAICERKVG